MMRASESRVLRFRFELVDALVQLQHPCFDLLDRGHAQLVHVFSVLQTIELFVMFVSSLDWDWLDCHV